MVSSLNYRFSLNPICSEFTIIDNAGHYVPGLTVAEIKRKRKVISVDWI